jgi:glycosyltransferase involved in cell wall biosynthesis
MKNLSFFAKSTYFTERTDRKSGKFLRRVSTRIRGEEMSEYLGAKLNPTENYENDVCVHVKPNYTLKTINDGDYADVLDDLELTRALKNRPSIKVISMSTPHHEWLKTFLQNEVTLIPHHHVNIDRVTRDRNVIINCGYVGANNAEHILFGKEVEQRLSKIGLTFVPLFNFTTRDDIINFYKTIDIQIIPYFGHLKNTPHFHATKIINAMSFGVPTIAEQKLGYRDIEGFYIPVSNIDELIQEAQKLKDPAEYDKWPKKIIAESEKYHISEIAKLYQHLQ